MKLPPVPHVLCPVHKVPLICPIHVAAKGGRVTKRKYGKKQQAEWGKLGGRPRGKKKKT